MRQTAATVTSYRESVDRLPEGFYRTLDEAAAALDWPPDRLAKARAHAAVPRPSKITDRDQIRAQIASDATRRTAEALNRRTTSHQGAIGKGRPPGHP